MDKQGVCDKCNQHKPICCGEEIIDATCQDTLGNRVVRRRGVCKECCPEHGPRKAIRPPPPPVMPRPLSGGALGSGEWKKRALAAEAKLAGHKRLRALAEKVAHQANEDTKCSKWANLVDELGTELYHLDVVDPPKDFLNQKVAKVDIEIRTSSVMGDSVSSFDPRGRLVEVNAQAPAPAQYAGLLYQLVQAADLACANNGLSGGRVSAEWLQSRCGALLALLIATGLLNPAVPVEYGDVESISGG